MLPPKPVLGATPTTSSGIAWGPMLLTAAVIGGVLFLWTDAKPKYTAKKWEPSQPTGNWYVSFDSEDGYGKKYKAESGPWDTKQDAQDWSDEKLSPARHPRIFERRG